MTRTVQSEERWSADRERYILYADTSLPVTEVHDSWYHAAFISVWVAGVKNQDDRMEIEKVLMCGSRSSPIDAMTFDVEVA
ncbi:unnamed protein product [Peronospora belbahrii]|uniref:Uncharacterized protein n=1 Tax=Peronospora belbahrii TaxID=622444 RepID=A0AAU9LC31_9STRA|nr:unnamed protein product [Peronospora belbahrii]CAH0478678.1 unnamed protein product [Peronospora belbahrii]CAH0478695.1 unnamed protein product [Peronospora belbahrii]